ncbi:peroxide stress protein YaaA [uncultured Nonlabens sp.]|uniref:peroxide stress protein YaaA n=1 Tax=uncultured Nonlabens sp. TaxID=859306 RepID=UPI00261640C8|nr:peroxide stress protein YaaA [uncultured Nonlabens sp.]
MKILLSPAKSLDYKTDLPTNRATQPLFVEDAIKINAKLERMSKGEVGELMHISDKLADLNYQRYKSFESDFNTKNARPAIYAFSGDVYTGFNAYDLDTQHLDYAQENIRILSGMYGYLRPLDLLQPYRLEMGTSLPIENNKNLYEFWKDKITPALNKEIKEGELLVNLASNEYFKAIDKKQQQGTLISPVFKDFKNGKLKIISFFAKRARGTMARYLVENKIDTLKGIQSFAMDDYKYSEQETLKENEPVFVR